MNKEDIKKALVQCSDFKYCDDCPYFNRENKRCRTKLQCDALNLITEQEKEIEQLKSECEYRKKQYDNQVAENTRLHIEYDKAFERLKAQQREIDALKDENEELAENLDMLIKEQKGENEELKAQQREIAQLQENYSKLQELFANYQLASDKEIRAQVRQAKIDVLNELKAKSYVNDYCREVVEVEKIDELLKELTK